MSFLSSLLLVKKSGIFVQMRELLCLLHLLWACNLFKDSDCVLSLLTRNKAIFEIKDGSLGKESAWQCRRPRSSISGLGRSSGVGNGSPLQYSCLKNPTDRGAWRVTVHGVTNHQTQLSNWHYWDECRGWAKSEINSIMLSYLFLLLQRSLLMI